MGRPITYICITFFFSLSLTFPVSTLEDLYIHEDPYWRSRWRDNVENTLWLELLHLFTTTKNLYLCKRSAPHVSPILQEVAIAGRMLEVLPNVQNIFLQEFPPSGLVQEGVGLFATARRLFCRPTTIYLWDIDWD